MTNNTGSNDAPFIYDALCYKLEEYFNENLRFIQEQIDRKLDQACVGLKELETRKATKKLAISLLVKCQDEVEKQLNIMCFKQSADVWFTLVRRMPNSILPGTSWFIPASLSIIKYSNYENDTTLGLVKSEKQFGVKHEITDEKLCSAFCIARLSSFFNYLSGLIRWVGKGATLKVVQGRPKIEIPEDVKKAVDAYEYRRPSELLLNDIGTPLKKNAPKEDIGLMLMGGLKESVPIYLQERNATIFLQNYIPNPIDIEPVRSLLLHYSEAIEEAYGIRVDCILQVLAALCIQINTTIPEINNNGNNLQVADKYSNEEREHRTRFLFDLCTRGYIAMPEKDWTQRLSWYGARPLGRSKEEAFDLVKDFFKVFVIDGQKNELINMKISRPCPFAVRTPNGNLYIDLVLTMGFVESIIEEAKTWLATQHGDRFNIFAKRYVDSSNLDNVKTVYNFKINKPNVENTQIDLLIECAQTVICVECKAYTKSRDFLVGMPAAINSRTGQIKKAVEQAKRAAENYKLTEEGKKLIKAGKDVEWLVCSSTQEYLYPLDRFGMIDDKIPRVCTLEELVLHLQRKPG